MKKKIKVGNWEVCCNDMVDGLIRPSIEATESIDGVMELFIDNKKLNYCPWCRKKINV